MMKFNCDQQNRRSWQVRSNSAIDLLSDYLGADLGIRKAISIADFGCGNEHLNALLQDKLKINFTYKGYDLYPQQDSTEKIDLSSEMPTSLFDLVFCLGLLEYIEDLENILFKISKITKFLIMSYTVKDSEVYSQAEVAKNGWLHHYSVLDVDKKLSKSGFMKKGFILTDGARIGIWLLQSKSFQD